jgi:hypothetical protein
MLSKLLRRALLLSALPCLTACAIPTAVVTDKGCSWTTNITRSQKDTPQTQREVIGHNAARKSVCDLAKV